MAALRLKTLIKGCLPKSISVAAGKFLIARREQHLGRLSLPRAFDEVYKKGMWTHGQSTSGPGSEGSLALKYVDFVRNYAKHRGLHSAVDGGCGDFSIGARLQSAFEQYHALDVSRVIIDIDRQRYASLSKSVTFGVADLTETQLPAADLVLIREVLQHLTNAQIHKILENIEKSTWRRVLISEMVHDAVNNQCPNLDLPSHTIRTRTSLYSGVFVDRPPFSLRAKRLTTLYASEDGPADRAGLLVIELSRDAAEP